MPHYVIEKGNSQDRQFNEFFKSNPLYSEQRGADKFFHPNKDDKAEIDDILMNNIARQVMKAVSVENKTAQNTSNHIPVVGTLNIAPDVKSKEKIELNCKPKWDNFLKAQKTC